MACGPRSPSTHTDLAPAGAPALATCICFPGWSLCVRLVVDGPQVLQSLFERDHVGVFCVEIEQTLLVRRGRAVADRLAHDHGSQPRLHGINRRGADAAAGGTAGNDDRVDAPAQQPRHKIGPEEARGIFLHQQAVALAKIEPRIDLYTLAVSLQRHDALLLEGPDAGILEIDVVVDHGRKNHRDTAVVRDGKERLYWHLLVV